MYKKAINIFNRCLTYNMPIEILSLVYEQLGKCYTDINDNKNAEVFLLKAIETQKNVNSEIYSRIGFIYFEKGNYQKAKDSLKKAASLYNKRDYTNIDLVQKYLSRLEEE